MVRIAQGPPPSRLVRPELLRVGDPEVRERLAAFWARWEDAERRRAEAGRADPRPPAEPDGLEESRLLCPETRRIADPELRLAVAKMAPCLQPRFARLVGVWERGALFRDDAPASRKKKSA
jgi:hypothetical protein